MLNAYAAFANEGYKVTPHLITKVEDMDGNVLYEFNEEPDNILNKSLVYIMNELLTSIPTTLDGISYHVLLESFRLFSIASIHIFLIASPSAGIVGLLSSYPTHAPIIKSLL